MAPSTTSPLRAGPDGAMRCFWYQGHDDYLAYHDNEWGYPVGDDTRLFEKICLEGFQSGLSWLTILRKRENFRRAFAGFEIEKVARFGEADVARLLTDAGIVRHRGKIEATINNARQAESLIEDEGSLAAFLWAHEPDDAPAPETMADLAARAILKEATTVSKILRKRGWRFVGPTTITSMFQAVGIVNDHFAGCASRPKVEAARAAFQRPTA
ncbi:MAG: DNA-3-methyladenine glycosylase I [Pseudomonadota bacterium]